MAKNAIAHEADGRRYLYRPLVARGGDQQRPDQGDIGDRPRPVRRLEPVRGEPTAEVVPPRPARGHQRVSFL
ncbi:hypothetical protein ACTGZM_11095 [Streptococcus suis]